MGPGLRWLIVAAVLLGGFAAVALLSAWDTDISSLTAGAPAAPGDPGSMAAMTPLAPNADGLRRTAAGLTLEPASKRLTAGRTTTWRFTIRDAAGKPVTRFERDQTKLLHLIVARRDLTGYQHLHPVLDRAGEFSVPITIGRPGTYRAIADFVTEGKRYVLGVDLKAPGSAPDRALPAPATRQVVDGYSVRMTPGDVAAGRDSTVRFRVTRNGRPVERLQRYLGAFGHLVALRTPDLAYAHVHPTSADPTGGAIRFSVDLPERASYRLFFQFKVRDVVRTAAFTVRAH
jgi:hypothetical protein